MLWLDFKNAVLDFITVDANRQGIQAGLVRKIRMGVINLQSYIERYRKNHEIVYQEDDLSIEGEASYGLLPRGALPRHGFYLQSDLPCKQQPLVEYSWENRNDLICGAASLIRGQYLIAFDRSSQQFYVYPKVEPGTQVSIYYDASKTDFGDTEDTPFEEETAEAVSFYVKAWVAKEVDKDLRLSQSYEADFNAARTGLYIDSKDESRFRDHNPSPQPDSKCNQVCPIPADDTVEIVAFGDSGEASTIANTEAVATLVKGLRPDMILHLGDSVYPSGDPVTISELLTKYYFGWIPDDFYLCFGNHCQDTDGGAGLMALLPQIGEANGGKKYYKFTRGPVDFFVLNSGATGVFDPDGETEASVQGQWLVAEMAASSNTWKVVVLHKAPYSSNATYTPGQVEFRWNFKAMGADLVLSGHGHDYERILVGDLQYLVCGLGGATKVGFGATTTGSQFRYNTKHGCLRLVASATKLQCAFITVDREMIDQLILRK